MSLNSTPNAERSEPGDVLELAGRHVLALRSTGPEHEKLDAPAQTLENMSFVSSSPAEESAKAPGYGCPIQRLPVELLAMVFRNAVLPDSDGFLAMRRAGKPYKIAYTCRHWRDVALHSPELWSVVDYLINDLWTIQLEERVAASLRLHLDRSSSLSLDVSIDLYDRPQSMDGPLLSALSALFRRARTFRLYISVDVHAALGPMFSQQAPHLAHLSFSDAEYHLVGSQLVHLGLETPQLQILECYGAPVLFSGRAHPSVRAVSLDLERNQFQCPSFADLLRYFPNAVSVDIGWYDERFNPHANPARLIEATHLETLTVKGAYCFFPYNLARCLSFPSLRRASVKYLSTRPGRVHPSAAVTVFISSALRTVRTLELNFNVGYDISLALIAGLESCLHLEHLTLHAYGRDSDAGVDVITALSKTDTPWLCAQLQTLTLHIRPQALGDFGGALLNLATKRAASRLDTGQGLTQISVYLKEYVDSEDAADKHELSLLRQLLNGILSSPSRLPQWPSPYAPRS